jgi:hypothetical protein
MFTSCSDQTWPGLDLQMAGLLQMFIISYGEKYVRSFFLLYSEILGNVTTPYTRLFFLFTQPLKMEQTEIMKHRHIKFRRRVIAQEKEYIKDLLLYISHSLV